MIMDELQGAAPFKAPRAPLTPAAPGPAAGPSNAATMPAPAAAIPTPIVTVPATTAHIPQPPTYGAPAPSRKRKATYDPNDVIDLSEM